MEHRRRPQTSFLFFTALLVCLPSSFAAFQNVTTLLDGHPDYSSFNSLLSQNGVAAQINSRTTITVLCPSNPAVDAFVSGPGAGLGRQALFNVLSFHVLLDYEDPQKLRTLTGGSAVITTLFQTTGLATGSSGFMNITVIKGSPKVLLPGTSSSFSSIGSSLEKFPYNISLLAIDRVLIPAGVISGGSPPPAPVNLTQIISQSGNFSSFITSLRATGVDKVLQSHDAEPGLTIFAPTNAAFDRLGSAALRRLSSVQLVALLEFHALPSFYPTEELATANGPQPTLASGASAESFTITLSRNKAGTIIINAGGNKVAIAGTLYSNNPVAIFQINDVLMPEDIFGKAPESPPLPAPPPTLTPATPPSAATPAGLPRSFARAPSPAPLLAKPPSSSQSPVPNTSLTTSPATTPPSPLAPSDAFAPSEGPSALSPDSLASSSHVAASFSPLFLLFTVSVLLFYTM